jgi:hypothetical protein
MRGNAGKQLQAISLVHEISISNQVAKQRRAVSFFCRLPNAASACNAGGSSSLHTRVKAAVHALDAQQRTSKSASVFCSMSQTHNAS